VVIGLGNAPSDPAIIAALEQRSEQAELFTEEVPWLYEHFAWALAQQYQPNRRRKRKIKRADR
jgi:epoxyqueuosine reductase